MKLRTLSHQEFMSRLKHSKKGDRIVYHVGSLMYDRLVGPDRDKVDGVGDAAYAAYEMKTVNLFQHKVVPGMFEYIAVVR